MTEIGSGPPDPRVMLRAELAACPDSSLQPAALVSTEPLRPLPGALVAKLEVRRRRGLDPTGADHPRRERWQTLVVPELILAPVAAVVLGVALILGKGLVAAIGGVLLAACALGAVVGRQRVRADPLRIHERERRVLSDGGHWESKQPWAAATNSGPERALLGLAVDVVARIAASPAWRSGYLDGHRMVLDLTAELDAVDLQTFTIASARVAGGAGSDLPSALDAAIDRVQALRDYQASLAALTVRTVVADAELNAAQAIGALRSGADQDVYASGGVRRLTDEVQVITASVDRTAAEVRQQRP
jgi:hypothetical protein